MYKHHGGRVEFGNVTFDPTISLLGMSPKDILGKDMKLQAQTYKTVNHPNVQWQGTGLINLVHLSSGELCSCRKEWEISWYIGMEQSPGYTVKWNKAKCKSFFYSTLLFVWEMVRKYWYSEKTLVCIFHKVTMKQYFKN